MMFTSYLRGYNPPRPTKEQREAGHNWRRTEGAKEFKQANTKRKAQKASRKKNRR